MATTVIDNHSFSRVDLNRLARGVVILKLKCIERCIQSTAGGLLVSVGFIHKAWYTADTDTPAVNWYSLKLYGVPSVVYFCNIMQVTKILYRHVSNGTFWVGEGREAPRWGVPRYPGPSQVTVLQGSGIRIIPSAVTAV